MRLLHVDSLEFADFPNDNARPKYVIASHRWVNGSETTLKDVKEKRNKDEIGYKKVEAFAKYIRERVSSIKWLWIDTCCINKDSEAELSEAINSMFKWYRNAELCIAYLANVETVKDRCSFEQEKWFRRGWTLQELLAPRLVVFVTKTWQVLGNKGSSFYSYDSTPIGPGLGGDIARITGISEPVLNDYGASVNVRIDEKMKWIEGRRTTREEDMSYALFGIVGITPGANYGEGRDGARQRLLAAIRQRDDATQEADRFQKIVNWLSLPDPWTNHELARQRREPEKEPLQREPRNCQTGLYYASRFGLETVVKELLSEEADVNAQGGFRNNALQMASYVDNEHIVQMLLDAGADVNAQGEDGVYSTALQEASGRGNEKVVQMLINAGADVNAQVGDALQAASSRGNEKVVQILINAGADVNAQGGKYGNALLAASFSGKRKVVQIQKIVQILINAGADVNARGGGSFGNALHAAAYRGNEEVVQILINAGADVNVE